MDRVATVSAIRHRPRQASIGVDVGGTWLRVAARDERRRTTVRARADRDLSRLPAILRAIWRRRGWRPARVASLVVASRATWTERECRALARRLRRLARRVRVISDAQAALLGALGGRAGVLVLAGTGSIVIGYDGRRRWARAGGLGPLVGDEGSAFWLGREWLRTRAQRGDLRAVLRAVHAADAVARLAAIAPRVLARARRGDGRARAIARRGQDALAAQARQVAKALGLRPPVAASWAGSVLDDAWFRAGLIRAIARAGLRARWRRPAAEPVVAALRLAEQLQDAPGPR
jgi:N-acetylglucosamine kinase-like BadF-type ATPase